MKKLWYLFLFFLPLNLVAQQPPSFDGQKLNLKHQQLSSNFLKYDAYQLNSQEIYNYALEKSIDGRIFNLKLRLPGHEDYSIMLETNKQLSYSNALVMTKGKDGVQTQRLENNQLYLTGFLSDNKQSQVALTIGSNTIYGFIDDGTSIKFIEPISYLTQQKPSDQFVFYDTKDVVSKDVKCAAIEMERQIGRTEQQFISPNPCITIYTVQIALAADFSMFQKYNDVLGVTQYLTGVMNNVQTNYDDEFDFEVRFDITGFLVSNCLTCDPWTFSTDATTLLSSFSQWSNNYGFGNLEYDIAGLWTDRDLDGPVIGVAYTGGTCADNRYHLCQDFSTNAQLIRVLTAHEIGHNFGLEHNDPAVGCIMDPSVTTTNCWSAQSQETMNRNIPAFSCLQNNACTVRTPPATPPGAINNLCGDEQKCINLGSRCTDFISAFDNDPDLTVSTFGTTLCLQSTECTRRSAVVNVYATDGCGQISNIVSWPISINADQGCCPRTLPCNEPVGFNCDRSNFSGMTTVTWANNADAESYEWRLQGSTCCLANPQVGNVTLSGSTNFPRMTFNHQQLGQGCYALYVRTNCADGKFSNWSVYCLEACNPQIFISIDKTKPQDNANDGQSNDLLGVEQHQIVPNPNGGTFNLMVEAAEPGFRELAVFDLSGREIWRNEVVLNKGHNQVGIAIPTIQNGVYIFSVNDGKEIKTQKFIVNTSLR
ncbi:MAG: zinc-dependent metalloprotease [Bacteroidota bacterium]